jgi:hypothetical protein
MYFIKENSYSALKETIKSMEEGLRNMAMVEVGIHLHSHAKTNKIDENHEKQEKLREYAERDRQMSVIRVSRVVKSIDRSYDCLPSPIAV